MGPKTYAERQDLLGLALDIHMAHTGSFPDLSDDNLEHAMKFIQTRLDGWSSLRGRGETELFDTAVKMLLTVAVQEGRLLREYRLAWKSV